MNLSRSAQLVQSVIDNNALDCVVKELPTSTATALEAAQSIGCNLSQIIKSIIFKTKTNNKPILVLVSGSNRVDEQQLKKYVGQDILKADASFVKNITGFAIGGVPPFGHKTFIDEIYIDEALMVFDTVWAAAGTPHAVFSITPHDLLHATKAKVISVVIER